MPFTIQRGLQDHHGGRLIDDRTVLASRPAGRVQRLVRAHSTHPLVHQSNLNRVDGTSDRSSVRACGLRSRALGPGKVAGKSDIHNSHTPLLHLLRNPRHVRRNDAGSRSIH